jgi:pimeloyl-ACP methyl ester carboxylesterase
MIGRFGWEAFFRSWGERRPERSSAAEVPTPEPVREASGFDLVLSSGRLRAHRFGDPDGHLVLCIPGLSSTSRTFDYIGEGLAEDGLQVVALDLRGRGFSDVTRPGSYGWAHHAEDVLEAARALGATSFDVVGHSMGAYVGLHVARIAPRQLRRLVLIDGGGIPRYAAFRAILRGIERLDRTYSTADEYVAAVRGIGVVTPWNEYWERAFRYDLVEVDGRVRPRTSSVAVFEDVVYGASHDPRLLWHGIDTPTLILRAALPMAGRDGFILTEFDTENFIRLTPSAHAKAIEANHFGIIVHPDTVNALRTFLR